VTWERHVGGETGGWAAVYDNSGAVVEPPAGPGAELYAYPAEPISGRVSSSRTPEGVRDFRFPSREEHQLFRTVPSESA